MSETATFNTVIKLLQECAVGHEIRSTTHYILVKYNGRVFPTLPAYENIELGHIRKMVRTLEINKECANKHVPGLFKIEKPAPESSERAAAAKKSN